VLVLPVFAAGTGQLQGYFSDASHRVKATVDPAEKRQILNNSFESMSAVLGVVRSLPLVSKDDVAGIDHARAAINEKKDELAGTNGYARVPDARLNAFSDYVVQDMEQADQVITISVVTLLLIIILIVLIVK
jgi:hypothetical protein